VLDLPEESFLYHLIEDYHPHHRDHHLRIHQVDLHTEGLVHHLYHHLLMLLLKKLNYFHLLLELAKFDHFHLLLLQ
tara:strand:- start:139 stop:366 length:228 start_codon:yes stop_codon:yes gene_type:complete